MIRGNDITYASRDYREQKKGEFPDRMEIRLKKAWDLKYGENPAQHGAIYDIVEIAYENTSKMAELTDLRSVRTNLGKGGLSLTNVMDIARGMDVLKYFSMPAVAILKHNIISGFAKQTEENMQMPELYKLALQADMADSEHFSDSELDSTLTQLFRFARNSDLRSNFGGTAVFNKPLDMKTAEAIYELRGQSPFFVDVIAAPDYEENVKSYIEKKSVDIRIGQFSGLDKLPKFQGDETYGLLSFKEIPGGRIGVQDIYLTSIRNSLDIIERPLFIDRDGTKHIIERFPTKREMDDLLTAWYLNIAGARSNGIVIVRNGVTVAIGSGQVERVGAVEQAIVKGMQKAMDREGIEYDPLYGIMGHEKLKDQPFVGAACSSDAFFPFPDSIEWLARVGVTAIIQPYGSNPKGKPGRGDPAAIDAANKYGIAMPATLERCFGHF